MILAPEGEDAYSLLRLVHGGAFSSREAAVARLAPVWHTVGATPAITYVPRLAAAGLKDAVTPHRTDDPVEPPQVALAIQATAVPTASVGPARAAACAHLADHDGTHDPVPDAPPTAADGPSTRTDGESDTKEAAEEMDWGGEVHRGDFDASLGRYHPIRDPSTLRLPPLHERRITLAEALQELRLRKEVTSGHNLNCLAYSILLGTDRIAPAAQWVTKERGDEERRRTHETIVRRLPPEADTKIGPNGVWWAGQTRDSLTRTMETSQVMGEAHVHGFCNRIDRCIVIVDVRESAAVLYKYLPGYAAQSQISMREAHELRNSDEQPIWVLLEPDHFSALLPIRRPIASTPQAPTGAGAPAKVTNGAGAGSASATAQEPEQRPSLPEKGSAPVPDKPEGTQQRGDAAETKIEWATRIFTDMGYTIGARTEIGDADVFAIARYVADATAGVEEAGDGRFNEAAVREYIREGGGDDSTYPRHILRQAVGDYLRLQRGAKHARDLSPAHQADNTADDRIVWPGDSVRLQREDTPGQHTRWKAWKQGTTGTVLRSAGRGDWTVLIEDKAGKIEVHVHDHEVHLLAKRAPAAGDVILSTRSTPHTTAARAGRKGTPGTHALILRRRAPDDVARGGATWHAFHWHDHRYVVVHEEDMTRAPWQAPYRQQESTLQSLKAQGALVTIAQRVYAQTGDWGGEILSATMDAAARDGLHTDAGQASRAIQEAKQRWQGGRPCAHMVTLNHGGILVRLRETTAAIPGQRRMATAPAHADTAALAWEADGRLWRTMHTLADGNDVVLLQETHLPELDPEGRSEQVMQMLTSGEYSTWRAAASPAPVDDAYAGVLMWWNTATVEVTEIQTLTPGRLQRARVRVLADGTDFIVVNAYVPTKRGAPTVRQATILERVRAQIQATIDTADDAGDEIVIGGDLQAQTSATLEARKDTGSVNAYDSWLDTLCAEHCLLSVGDDEPTYSGGAGGPQTTIDHWLVSTGLADRAAAEVGAGADGLAGLGDGTHGHNSLQLSITLRTAEAEDAEEKWEQREPQLPPMDEDEWAAFAAEEADTATTAADGVDGTGGPTFGQAARRLEAIEAALKGLVSRIQELSERTSTPQGTKVARLHARMLRWRRWLRACDGQRRFPDTHDMFNTKDCAHVFGDAPATDDKIRSAIENSAPGKERRVALREVCRSRLLHARERYEDAAKEGAIDKDRVRTRLLADINKAMEEGRDPRWECFRAVGRAKAALAGKRTAPRLDQPGMRSIKRTGAARGVGSTLRRC